MQNSQLYSDLTSDIENERVKQLILAHHLDTAVASPAQQLRTHQQELREHQSSLNHYEQRRWLAKQGKKYLIDFDSQQRKEMKHYFNALDQRKTGAIGIDQLEELLFSVGLMETREEIKALIDSVDEKKTGRIEFADFLSMIQNDDGQNEQLVTFFKQIIGQKGRQGKQGRKGKDDGGMGTKSGSRLRQRHEMGLQTQYSLMPKHQMSMNCTHSVLRQHSNGKPSMGKYPYPKGLPFELVVSHIRRKHMMAALNINQKDASYPNRIRASCSQADNPIEQIAKGQRVMQALQKMYERKLIRQIKENKRTQSHLANPKQNQNAARLGFPTYSR